MAGRGRAHLLRVLPIAGVALLRLPPVQVLLSLAATAIPCSSSHSSTAAGGNKRCILAACGNERLPFLGGTCRRLAPLLYPKLILHG